MISEMQLESLIAKHVALPNTMRVQVTGGTGVSIVSYEPICGSKAVADIYWRDDRCAWQVRSTFSDFPAKSFQGLGDAMNMLNDAVAGARHAVLEGTVG